MKNKISALFIALSLSACTASIPTARDFRPINPSLYDLIHPYAVTDNRLMYGSGTITTYCTASTATGVYLP